MLGSCCCAGVLPIGALSQMMMLLMMIGGSSIRPGRMDHLSSEPEDWLTCAKLASPGAEVPIGETRRSALCGDQRNQNCTSEFKLRFYAPQKDSYILFWIFAFNLCERRLSVSTI